MALLATAGKVGLPLAGGAIAGLLVTVFGATRSAPPVQAEPSKATAKTGAAECASPRLRPAAGQGAAMPSSTPVAESPPAPPIGDQNVPMDPMVERQRDLDNHRTLLKMHEQEPVDRAWSSEMETTVRTGVVDAKNLSKFTVDVNKVDCRSVSCVVDLSWSSGTKAAAEYDQLLTVSGQGIPCVQTITLEDADPATGVASAKMYIDCTEHRHGEQNNHRREDSPNGPSHG